MSFNLSTVAFLGAMAAVVAVVVGVVKPKSALLVAGGLLAVGFATRPSTTTSTT